MSTMELSARIDRGLVRTRFASSRYLLLEVTAPALARQRSRQPLNLALVLDRSGSMAGAKLALARDAATMLVRQLDERDRVCVVTYDDEVSLIAPSRAATPAAKAELARLIGAVQSGGSTNLGGGWLEGCREVAEHQNGSGAVDRALLLTDGLANVGIVDQEELCRHAAELRKRGISTSTFGVGDDYNEDLLQAMADKGGGNYFYLRGADDLAPGFRQELGDLMELSARDVVLEVRAPGSVLEPLNDYATEPLPDGLRIRLGDLISREQKAVVINVVTPPAEAGQVRRVEAVAMYREPDLGRGRELVFPPVTLRHAPDVEVDAQASDFDVTKRVGLLYAARAKREATALNREGRFDEARRILERTAERIESYAGSDQELLQAARDLRGFAVAAQSPMPVAFAREATFASYLHTRGRKDYR